MKNILYILLFIFSSNLLYPQAEEDFLTTIEKELEDKTQGADQKKNTNTNSQQTIDRVSIPNILIAADFTGAWDIGAGAGNSTRNTANIREVEFGLFNAIDQWGIGSVLFAVHNEGGEFFVELHEAYFEFNQLPYNLFLKLGKYFFDVGRLNSIHRHDWKFTIAPLVHKELFDPEAVEDFGGEISYILPWSFYQELKMGIFNGRTLGHTHTDGFTKPSPLYTIRLKNFFSVFNNIFSLLGFSYLRYHPSTNPKDIDHTIGTDLTFKWQNGRLQELEWSTEFWYRLGQKEVTENEKKIGWYSFMEYKPIPIWRIGVRFDQFTEINTFNGSTDSFIDKTNYAQSLWVTLAPSEFSYFRLTIERQDYFGKVTNYVVRTQADFIMGLHPAHKF